MIYKNEDIDILEDELLKNIHSRQEGSEKDRLRVGRIIKNKMAFVRSVLNAEDYLKRKGLIK